MSRRNRSWNRSRNWGRTGVVAVVVLMIRHHLGGVHMLDAVLTSGDEPTVRAAARTMRAARRTGLANLTRVNATATR